MRFTIPEAICTARRCSAVPKPASHWRPSPSAAFKLIDVENPGHHRTGHALDRQIQPDLVNLTDVAKQALNLVWTWVWTTFEQESPAISVRGIGLNTVWAQFHNRQILGQNELRGCCYWLNFRTHQADALLFDGGGLRCLLWVFPVPRVRGTASEVPGRRTLSSKLEEK